VQDLEATDGAVGETTPPKAVLTDNEAPAGGPKTTLGLAPGCNLVRAGDTEATCRAAAAGAASTGWAAAAATAGTLLQVAGEALRADGGAANTAVLLRCGEGKVGANSDTPAGSPKVGTVSCGPPGAAPSGGHITPAHRAVTGSPTVRG